MKNTICGIEITQEHADNINATIERINNELQAEKRANLLNEVRCTLITNPHNLFKGTAEEYMKKYNL